MKIYTKLSLQWDGSRYILDTNESTWYDYNGPIELCCGATQAQTNLLTSQTGFYNTLQNQLQTVFGNSSTVFNDLINSYAPIVAAGPNQQGFSPGELSNLNSQAITETGQAYNNAKQAVGERIAAQGGGNAYLPSGAAIGPQLSLAESAANQTSSELSQIQQANYQTGRANWLSAAQGLAGAPGVFSPAAGFAGAANQAGEAAGNTANQIAQENNSWVNALIGAGAGIAGGALAGFNQGGSSSSPFSGMSPGQISSYFGGPSQAATVPIGGSMGLIGDYVINGGPDVSGYPTLIDNTPSYTEE